LFSGVVKMHEWLSSQNRVGLTCNNAATNGGVESSTFQLEYISSPSYGKFINEVKSIGEINGSVCDPKLVFLLSFE
jgi:hypothetical protein